ncbi:hypothetical protein PCANC_02491 [Puccinia coronata f. sp. avenae]|uniref:Uncharacterized protein n=1 Tax=Puccinia coronata f. sp. avenae TaxID=200324 RepID=A0A2N5VYK2_9BASI|nr:hypothetical protein PCANC_02491 [Puccinia coronata f. sp. avenae]
MRPADASGQGTRSVKKTEDQICTNQTLLRSIQLTHCHNCVDRTLLRSVRLTHDCKCDNQSLLVIKPEASNASTVAVKLSLGARLVAVGCSNPTACGVLTFNSCVRACMLLASRCLAEASI